MTNPLLRSHLLALRSSLRLSPPLSRASDVLRMKEQMLLSLLRTVTGTCCNDVDVENEATEEGRLRKEWERRDVRSKAGENVEREEREKVKKKTVVVDRSGSKVRGVQRAQLLCGGVDGCQKRVCHAWELEHHKREVSSSGRWLLVWPQNGFSALILGSSSLLVPFRVRSP